MQRILSSRLKLDAKALSVLSKNPKLASRLENILTRKGVSNEIDTVPSSLLYMLSASQEPRFQSHEDLVADNILSGRITSKAQLKLAEAFLAKATSSEIDFAQFDKECGIGVSLSESEIERYVQE